MLEAEGLNLKFSPEVDLEKLTIMIAKREGLGDLLAEGAALAAKKLGNNAEQHAMTVKGNEMVSTECRSQTNLAWVMLPRQLVQDMIYVSMIGILIQKLVGNIPWIIVAL